METTLKLLSTMNKKDILDTAYKATKPLRKAVGKKLKDTVMDTGRQSRSDHADTIIRNHVVWSMSAGFIPVLVADIFAVSAVQLDMIRQMCKVYDVDFSETQGKALVTSLTGTTLARLGAGSILKMVPGVGSVIGGATVSVFAGASTYALGEVFKKHFDSGGTILDFDPARLKKYYKEKFEKGKKVAREMKKQQEKVVEDITDSAENFAESVVDEVVEKMDDLGLGVETLVTESPEPTPATKGTPLEQLKKLGELRAIGVLNDDEFEAMKKKIIDQF